VSAAATGLQARDWLTSGVVHAIVALALWQLAVAGGPWSSAVRRLELPVRWAPEPHSAATTTSTATATATTATTATTASATTASAKATNATATAPRATARRPSTTPARPASVRARASPERQATVARVRPEAPAAAMPQQAAMPQSSGTAPGDLERAESAMIPASPVVATEQTRSEAAGAQAVEAPRAGGQAPIAQPSRAPVAPSADPSAKQLWRRHLEQLMREHKRYPSQARRMRQQGVVLVAAKFSADGDLLRCDVADSSGFGSLDEAALQLVRTAAELLRAQRAPGALAELRIPIAYELSGS